MSTFAVILPAAGQSRRFHDKAYKKPFAPLGGRAVWLHSAERFMNRADVKQVIVTVAAEDRDLPDRVQGQPEVRCWRPTPFPSLATLRGHRGHLRVLPRTQARHRPRRDRDP